jgi:hypothetical protein
MARVFSLSLPDRSEWKELHGLYERFTRWIGFKDRRPHKLVVLLSLLFLLLFIFLSVFAITNPNPAARIAIAVVGFSLSGILTIVFLVDLASRKLLSTSKSKVGVP